MHILLMIIFQRQAKTKASDLNETGIDLELMHLQKPNESFDVAKFYKVRGGDNSIIEILFFRLI